MKLTGKLKGISKDFLSGKFLITLKVEEDITSIYKEWEEVDLDISVDKHRQRRSLDANAYAWVLMSKIADKVHSSKEEIYEHMLQKYGYFYENDSGFVHITVAKYVDMSIIGGHWKFIKDNGKFSSYLMIKGSSEYNTQEMSNFIDRIVEEAKERGIETATPDELDRMKNLWKGSKHG